jgi:hypothetical protein
MSQSNPTHGGKRKGAGRKPALLPFFNKKLRATQWERKDFMSFLSGDARKDFELLYKLLKDHDARLDRI